MTKLEVLAICLAELARQGEELGGQYVYPDRSRVYVRSLKGSPGTYGAARTFIEAVDREDGRGWVFARNNRVFIPDAAVSL